MADLEETYETDEMTKDMTQGGYSMADISRLIEFLVEDKSIPKRFAENFWAFADKESAITYLEPGDINTLMMMFDVASLSFRMAKPDYKFTWDDQLQLSNLRMKFFIKTKRSTKGFERRLEATQIREIRTQTDAGIKKRGFVSRLFGLGGK